ncbi:uncharacterized protein [Physcomitrium patens]|uniref:Floricaula/leafy-like transcription factor n=1 Tax=Physcomitrium patens TaxID=3218 RepID=A0A7I4FVM1_PHYPA|nr:uncharacterized protein LOC112286713 isoform X2 [Physcomitrium patens]|eukprot:XP_024384641.1 uncharacterized protein LOC112286713 isoform X2 [Physcomitrella patens]
MVKVKGVEWNHVIVLKEPEKHGMATLVRCIHCDKEFQGNAMRIRAHLLGNKRQAGVTGCPTVPDDAREELRLIEIAREQTQKKRKPVKMRGVRGTSSASDHSSGSADHFDGKGGLGRKAERISLQHELLARMGSIMASVDLDTFFDGFGLRPETVVKIKEMGFTAKTLMSNLDELPSLLESINQHHPLTLGEEWGIKGAAKKWQREQTFLAHPEDEKWPDSEDTCKEVACIDTEEVTQLEPYPKWIPQQQQGQQLQSPHNHLAPPNLSVSNLSPPNQGVTDFFSGWSRWVSGKGGVLYESSGIPSSGERSL